MNKLLDICAAILMLSALSCTSTSPVVTTTVSKQAPEPSAQPEAVAPVPEPVAPNVTEPAENPPPLVDGDEVVEEAINEPDPVPEAAPEDFSALDQTFGDKPAVHGMLLFGESRFYFSHLPMFGAPHDYQVLVEVEFHGAKKQGGVTTVLEADRQATGAAYYTFVPKAFSLPDIRKKGFKIRGAIHRDHFERGGKELLPSVTARIKRVIHFRKLAAADADDERGKGLLFGTKNEAWVAHWIGGQPDHDEILRVTGSAEAALEELDFSRVYVLVGLPGAAPTGTKKDLSVTILPETTRFISVEAIYSEVGDLK